MPYESTWKERLEDAKVYLGPAIALLVVLGLAGWLVWHELLPRERTKKAAAAPTKNEADREQARKRLSGEVEVLEKIYRRAIDAGEGDAALGTMLDRVIVRQRERMKLDATADSAESARLARLEAERGSLRTRVATARSLGLEREALAAPGTAESMEKLREALRLQREANAAVGPPEEKNFQRESQLAQTVNQAASEPTRAALATALTLARSALVRGERESALKGFTEARRFQAELTRLNPESAFGTPARLEEIDAEIDSLKAAGLAEISAQREAEGDGAAKAGRATDAAAAYAAAAAIQREVNEKFPRSRAVSPARSEQLEVKRQTVLSVTPLTLAAANDREIAVLLRRRASAEAAERIPAALALVEKAATDFPRSTALDPVLRNRLAFLGLRVGDIEAVQRQVYAQLAPLTGAPGFAMLKAEVSQELFTRIMNSNPSRNPGRTLPVDSVSWLEAQEFCRRLGWLLGERVRLPTEAEFRSVYAAGEGAWSAATSDGRSHEVAKSPATPGGFHDLAGNLAEWLQSAKDTDLIAPVAGGSYLDAAESLRLLPVAALEKRERARHVGFRVVVERPAR